MANNKIGRFFLKLNFNARFNDTASYWENRYKNNGNSGPGSYGELALYKAGIINKFVSDNNISSVIEFGCGDGNQLKEFQFPSYTGLDVSKTAIEKCTGIFKDDVTKTFFIYSPGEFAAHAESFKADLTLSLDVIYHLLEDDVFETYMNHLFSSSKQFVIIYAWDAEERKRLHIKLRKFTAWIEKNLQEWHLMQTIENKSPHAACDFYIYQKGKAEYT